MRRRQERDDTPRFFRQHPYAGATWEGTLFGCPHAGRKQETDKDLTPQGARLFEGGDDAGNVFDNVGEQVGKPVFGAGLVACVAVAPSEATDWSVAGLALTRGAEAAVTDAFGVPEGQLDALLDGERVGFETRLAKGEGDVGAGLDGAAAALGSVELEGAGELAKVEAGG